MLEAMVGALTVCCFGAIGLSLWLLVQLRLQSQRQAEREAKTNERLDELAKRLDETSKRLETYLSGSVRLGKELRTLRELAEPLPERLNQLEQRDPGSVTYTQAARLVSMGASIDDLTRTCGLSQGEAELMRRMHEARRGRD